MEGNNETVIDKNIPLSVDEKIKARIDQSETSRMVEYVTGLSLENPELPNRLALDQQIIRARYGLPDRKYKFDNPREYELFLRGLAENNGIVIRSKSDCGQFFTEHLGADGVNLNREKIIGVNMDKLSDENYIDNLSILEHETIHSLQHKYYPAMPIEVMEYEAYVANWKIDHLRENYDNLIIMFDFYVKTSVNHWYRETSEKEGRMITPAWKDPEYFLRNIDGVSEEAIQKNRTEHQIDTEK